jgi:hypothetical protein
MQHAFEDGYSPLFQADYQEKCAGWCASDGQECKCWLDTTVVIVHVVGFPVNRVATEAQYRIRVYHAHDYESRNIAGIISDEYMVMDTVIDNTSQEEHRDVCRKYMQDMERFRYYYNDKFRARNDRQAYVRTVLNLISRIEVSTSKDDKYRQETTCAHLDRRKKKKKQKHKEQTNKQT